MEPKPLLTYRLACEKAEQQSGVPPLKDMPRVPHCPPCWVAGKYRRLRPSVGGHRFTNFLNKSHFSAHSLSHSEIHPLAQQEGFESVLTPFSSLPIHSVFSLQTHKEGHDAREGDCFQEALNRALNRGSKAVCFLCCREWSRPGLFLFLFVFFQTPLFLHRDS